MGLEAVVETVNREDCMHKLRTSVSQHRDGKGMHFRAILLFRHTCFAIATHGHWFVSPQERNIKTECPGCESFS